MNWKTLITLYIVGLITSLISLAFLIDAEIALASSRSFPIPKNCQDAKVWSVGFEIKNSSEYDEHYCLTANSFNVSAISMGVFDSSDCQIIRNNENYGIMKIRKLAIAKEMWNLF